MKLQRFSKRWQAAALVALVIFCFVACEANKITKENFDKIQTGMTQAQVQAILGEPTEASSVDVTVFSGTASKWKHGDTTITIQFVNGKVVAKQFSKAGESR